MTGLKRAIQRINSYKDWSHYLSLANLGLTSEDLEQLMPRLQKLNKLQKLDLSNNNIVSLPNSIESFPELTFLNLSKNHIENIPISVRRLTNSERSNHLNVLNLSNNNLKKLPKGIERDMLHKELILDNNSVVLSLSRAIKGVYNFCGQVVESMITNAMARNFDFSTPAKFILSNVSNLIKNHLKGGIYALEIEQRILSSSQTEFEYLDLSD